MVLGGTLGQLAIPVICGIAFWRERKYISTLLMVWWLGQSLVNVSVYVSDARAQVLPLLGGDNVEHDWAYILGQLHLLNADVAIGTMIFWLGGACMLFAIIQIVVSVWKPLQKKFYS